jgi:hypothetical protein
LDASDVLRLGLTLALAPAIVYIGLRVRLARGRLGLGVAYAAVLASGVFSVAGTVGHAYVFQVLEHSAFAVAGVALFFSVLATRRQVIDDLDASS